MRYGEQLCGVLPPSPGAVTRVGSNERSDSVAGRCRPESRAVRATESTGVGRVVDRAFGRRARVEREAPRGMPARSRRPRVGRAAVLRERKPDPPWEATPDTHRRRMPRVATRAWFEVSGIASNAHSGPVGQHPPRLPSRNLPDACHCSVEENQQDADRIRHRYRSSVWEFPLDRVRQPPSPEAIRPDRRDASNGVQTPR